MITKNIANKLLNRNPDKYHNLHKDIVGNRSGLTLEQYLSHAVLIGLIIGFIFGICGFLLDMLLFS
jgi:flagellar protein FlaJ